MIANRASEVYGIWNDSDVAKYQCWYICSIVQKESIYEWMISRDHSFINALFWQLMPWGSGGQLSTHDIDSTHILTVQTGITKIWLARYCNTWSIIDSKLGKTDTETSPRFFYTVTTSSSWHSIPGQIAHSRYCIPVFLARNSLAFLPCNLSPNYKVWPYAHGAWLHI